MYIPVTMATVCSFVVLCIQRHAHLVVVKFMSLDSIAASSVLCLLVNFKMSLGDETALSFSLSDPHHSCSKVHLTVKTNQNRTCKKNRKDCTK